MEGLCNLWAYLKHLNIAWEFISLAIRIIILCTKYILYILYNFLHTFYFYFLHIAIFVYIYIYLNKMQKREVYKHSSIKLTILIIIDLKIGNPEPFVIFLFVRKKFNLLLHKYVFLSTN